ncbi:amidohydrolase [Tersicoccus sp. Bi-70]|uniref:amidohydrolase family protein n=1 Tax=Tersicoccus sp. Bi-70 TaxID=1897634 RepID=UPI0009760C39|nr:amidohydrolase family protein [Tersicoccus sp. Bi-70]OMH36668.1 amidohydrolase [Tersicoccus sp. Bi-70]
MTHTLEVTTPGPDRHPHPPRVVLPPNACDAHVHIFGPHERFPYAPDRSFTPEDVPLEDLEALHRFLGFERAVLVQSACHGSDHRAVLDALERGEGRYRGVALVGPETSAADVERWHDAGMRGARVHFAPHLGTPPTQAEIARIVDLIGPYGWHLAIHVMGSSILDVADRVADIPLRIVIDHLGRFDISAGRPQPERDVLTALLTEHDDLWVKLSGADRIATRPPRLDDAVALARELFTTRPDRCVWGTDFPHPNTHGFMPNDGDLVTTLLDVAPTPEERELLLVRNPAVCFDFGPSA